MMKGGSILMIWKYFERQKGSKSETLDLVCNNLVYLAVT
jgi:hypothetical protein